MRNLIPLKYYSNLFPATVPVSGKVADKGFDAFIEAADHQELYDIEIDFEVYKKGFTIL